jgi:hypothetical protein
MSHLSVRRTESGLGNSLQEQDAVSFGGGGESVEERLCATHCCRYMLSANDDSAVAMNCADCNLARHFLGARQKMLGGPLEPLLIRQMSWIGWIIWSRT